MIININQLGQDLLKAKILYDHSKGTMFCNDITTKIQNSYGLEIKSKILQLNNEEFTKYIDENYECSLAEVLKNINNEIGNKFKTLITDNKLSVLYTKNVEWTFKFVNLIELMSQKNVDFVSEYIKGIICAKFENSNYEELLSYITVKYAGNNFQVMLDITQKNVKEFLDTNRLEKAYDFFDKIYEECDASYKGEYIDQYKILDTQLSPMANFLLVSMEEYSKMDIELHDLFYKTMPSPLSDNFVKKSSTILKDYLKSEDKYLASIEDKLMYRKLFLAKSIIRDFSGYKNRYEIDMDHDEDFFTFSKSFEIKFDSIQGLDFSTFSFDKNKFLVEYIKSRTSYIATNEFAEYFCKEEMLSDIIVDSTGVIVKVKVKCNLTDERLTTKEYIVNILQTLDSMKFKVGLVK